MQQFKERRGDNNKRHDGTIRGFSLPIYGLKALLHWHLRVWYLRQRSQKFHKLASFWVKSGGGSISWPAATSLPAPSCPTSS